MARPITYYLAPNKVAKAYHKNVCTDHRQDHRHRRGRGEGRQEGPDRHQGRRRPSKRRVGRDRRRPESSDPTGTLSPVGLPRGPAGGARVDLLILGASARAAAFSALRIGLRPTCADLFADADLASACPVDPGRARRLSRGPGRFAELAADPLALHRGDREPARPGRPDLRDAIRSWATPARPSGRSATRSPWPRPSATAGPDRARGPARPGGPPVDGSLAGQAARLGRGPGDPPLARAALAPGRPVYYPGAGRGPAAGRPLRRRRAGRPDCLGITRQFVGRPGNRFAYRGSLGPWPVGRRGPGADRAARARPSPRPVRPGRASSGST